MQYVLHDKEFHNFVRFNKNNYGDRTKEDEMDEACSTHGRDPYSYKCSDYKNQSSVQNIDHVQM
jgi:hypothetical protein